MPTLDDTLDFLATCLENPTFKSYGDIMKSKYQHNKPEEDKETRRFIYEGTKMDPKQVEKRKESMKKRSKEEREAEIEKAAKVRAEWYKDPKNREKFMESLRKRDRKKKKSKTS